MSSDPRKRGSLAVRHVLDKYSTVASYTNQGNDPYDDNANSNVPNMCPSPVSNLIQRLDLDDRPKERKFSALASPARSIQRGKSPKQLTLPEMRTTRARCAADGTNDENNPSQMLNEVFDKQDSRSKVSSTTPSRRRVQLTTIEKPAASDESVNQYNSGTTDAIGDMLQLLRQNRNSFGNLPVNQVDALKNELEALVHQHAEDSVTKPSKVGQSFSQSDDLDLSPEEYMTRQTTFSGFPDLRGLQAAQQNANSPFAIQPRESIAPTQQFRQSTYGDFRSANTFAGNNQPSQYDEEPEPARPSVQPRQSIKPNAQAPGGARRLTLQKPSSVDIQSTLDPPVAFGNVAPNKSDPPNARRPIMESSDADDDSSPCSPNMMTQNRSFQFTESNPQQNGLSLEIFLPDLIRYQLQMRLLELGMKLDSENFSRAQRWAYHQVAYDINLCVSEGKQIHYCCLKRVIATMARAAYSLFTSQ